MILSFDCLLLIEPDRTNKYFPITFQNKKHNELKKLISCIKLSFIAALATTTALLTETVIISKVSLRSFDPIGALEVLAYIWVFSVSLQWHNSVSAHTKR